MSRGCKVCCGVATILILIVIIVFVILGFTVFKPKDPEITARPVNLDDFEINATTMSSNVSIGMIITVGNKNYGSFRFGNSSATITYRGDLIGDIPISGSKVEARSKINISTNAVIMASRLLANPNVYVDILGGNLTLKSDALLRGKVNMLKIVKLPATVSTHCDMNIGIVTKSVESNCYSKLKL